MIIVSGFPDQVNAEGLAATGDFGLSAPRLHFLRKREPLCDRIICSCVKRITRKRLNRSLERLRTRPQPV
jgi:hypothetical protein